MPTRPLGGRVALVTGANHGIGAATAVALARRGCDVAVTYLRLTDDRHLEDAAALPPAYVRSRQQDGAAVLTAVAAAGARGLVVEADLADPAVAPQLFDRVEADLGPVSVLVNNASGWCQDSFAPDRGDPFARPVHRLDASTFDGPALVDARGAALLMAELAARLRSSGRHGGRIISLTSGSARGFPGEVSYGAAKAALENLTQSASIELADLGVTANVVHPPVTDTGWITDEVRRFVDRSPDHVHVADPSEVAEVIAWLCTDAARLVTGNVIHLR